MTTPEQPRVRDRKRFAFTPSHTADDCPLGVQLLARATPPNASYVCAMCGREWFVGTITPAEPETVFARFGRWFRRTFR